MHRLLAPVICLCLVAPALGDPRPFTFTTDAYPMGKGEWEYEQWVTYSGTETDRFDFRHELEFGITDNFDLSVYFFDCRHQVAADVEFNYAGGAVKATVPLPNPSPDKFALPAYAESKVPAI